MNWEERRAVAGKYVGFDELGNTLYKVNHSHMLKKEDDKKRALMNALIEDGYDIEEYLDQREDISVFDMR